MPVGSPGLRSPGDDLLRIASRLLRGFSSVTVCVSALAAGALGGCRPVRGNEPPFTVVTDSLLHRDARQEMRLVRLRDREGVVHESWLKLVPPPAPAATSRARYQPVLVLGGIGTGRRAAEIVPCPPGFAVMALDYPYRGPRAPSRSEILRFLPEIRRSASAAPHGVAAAVRYLARRGDMAPDGAIVVAASFGVPFVLKGLADLPRERARDGRDRGPAGVRAVSLLFGGADLPELARYRLRDRPAWEREAAAWGLVLLFSDLEPAGTVGKVSPRPLLLINGREDEFVSPASARALERAAREPKLQLWLSSRHLQPDARELVQELVLRTLMWLRSVEKR